MICMCLDLNRRTVDELIKLFFTPCTQISIFLYVILYDNHALQIIIKNLYKKILIIHEQIPVIKVKKIS